MKNRVRRLTSALMSASIAKRSCHAKTFTPLRAGFTLIELLACQPKSRLAGRRQARSGFTLIELLVVIAIISVLMALLSPALKSARESAKSVVCINNLRTLGLTFILYSDDYDGFFPDAYRDPGQYYYDGWGGPIRHYLGGVNGPLADHSLTNYTLNPGGMKYENRIFFCPPAGNIRNRITPVFNNPFFCPSTYGNNGGPLLSQPGSIAWIFTDYGVNVYITGAPYWGGNPDPLKPKHRMEDLKAPGSTVFLADAESMGAFFWSRVYFSARHRNYTICNVLLADMHAEACRWSYIWTTSTNSQDISTTLSAATDGKFKAYMYP